MAWRGRVVELAPPAGLTSHHLLERDGRWQLLPVSSQPLPSRARGGELLALAAVLDWSRGVEVLCVVAAAPRSGGARLDILVCSGGPGSGEMFSWAPRGEVRCQSAARTVRLLDGPTAVWSEGRALCLAACCPRERSGGPTVAQYWEDMGAHVAPGGGGKDYVIDSFWCFNMPDGNALFFVRSKVSQFHHDSGIPKLNSRYGNQKWVCLVSQLSADKSLKLKGLPPETYIPSDYGEVAECIVLCHGYQVCGDGSLSPSTSALVGTQHRQVVVITGGYPLHAVSMETIPAELAVLEVCY